MVKLEFVSLSEEKIYIYDGRNFDLEPLSYSSFEDVETFPSSKRDFKTRKIAFHSKTAVTSVDNAHVRNFPPMTY